MPDVWHSRGYIPHWEAGEVPQAITFRLNDSLPKTVLESWQAELRYLPDDMANTRRRKRIEAALDQGHGEALLSDTRVAELVENAVLHFDADRYRLHAWTVMPNHVHVIATPLRDKTLSEIVHSWKSFTAKAVNRVLNRTGDLLVARILRSRDSRRDALRKRHRLHRHESGEGEALRRSGRVALLKRTAALGPPASRRHFLRALKRQKGRQDGGAPSRR